MDAFPSGWSVADCTENLLDQLISRVAMNCLPPAEPPAACVAAAAASLEANLDVGRACLNLTTPGLHLISLSPAEAERHFEEIQAALRPWLGLHPSHKPHRAAGYRGPWIENHWAELLYPGLWSNRSNEDSVDGHSQQESSSSWSFFWESLWAPTPRTQCLRDNFGSFLPIMLPWTDLWEPEGAHRLPPDLVPTLRNILRKDLAYVTLVQHDTGLALACEAILHDLFPNVLVLSSGGFGHVPVPLLKQPEPRNNLIPLVATAGKEGAPRAHLASFVGALGTAPQALREQLVTLLLDDAALHNYSAVHYFGAQWGSYSARQWRDVMADSRFQLVPRGYGNPAFSLILRARLASVFVSAPLTASCSQDERAII